MASLEVRVAKLEAKLKEAEKVVVDAHEREEEFEFLMEFVFHLAHELGEKVLGERIAGFLAMRKRVKTNHVEHLRALDAKSRVKNV